jgi:ATP-dependent exoDNAse (exonuclease V) alpha subunit
MALYHMTTKPVSRTTGRSAPASAAYRAAARIEDYATGKIWDYTRKQGVEHTEIVLPTEAAKRDINWARDREQLWNAAEAFEKRKDARVAREWEIALPHELGRTQRVDLAREFAGEIANRYGCAVDIAMHRPHRFGDHRNHHAHLFATTRTVEAKGLGRKTDIELGDRDRGKKGLGSGADEITFMRARWKTLINQRLKELGIEARVDHRSLKAQGIDREPTVHLGPSVIGMERRGIQTEVGNRVREEQRREMQLKLERAKELGQLARERHELEKSILDLSGDLQAALKERELALGLVPEHGAGPTREVPSSALREGVSLAERFEQQAKAAEKGAAQEFATRWQELGKERALVEAERQAVEEARERRAQELAAERAQEKALEKTPGKTHEKGLEKEGPLGRSIPLADHEREGLGLELEPKYPKRQLTLERELELERERALERARDLGLDF